MAIFEKTFADKVNYRTADKCCLNCDWMAWSIDCSGPCTNPETHAKTDAIVDDCGVCNLWKKKEKSSDE